VKKVKLDFAGFKVEFCDRERALKQVEEFARIGTRFPVVVFGPEGCGKTSWLRQATEVLKEREFGVIYFNPMRREFLAEVGIKSLEERVLELLKRADSVHALAGFVGYVVDFARDALKLGKKRIAIIVDDAFQYVGGKEAAFFVKGLLEMIEHPPESYERIVAIAATSEGLSRWEIGRHLWAELRGMWNMSKKGFEELYERVRGGVLGSMPDYEDTWATTGGNPRILAQLYQVKWSVDLVIERLAGSKKLDLFASSLTSEERKYLLEAIEDPDTLLARERTSLLSKLVEMNLVVDTMPERRQEHWIDEPPPQKDLKLGIGRRMAWQTPLHREAVRRALERL
jgi:hypothetical protein